MAEKRWCLPSPVRATCSATADVTAQGPAPGSLMRQRQDSHRHEGWGGLPKSVKRAFQPAKRRKVKRYGVWSRSPGWFSCRQVPKNWRQEMSPTGNCVRDNLARWGLVTPLLGTVALSEALLPQTSEVQPVGAGLVALGEHQSESQAAGSPD